jgi:hypothetical protein
MKPRIRRWNGRWECFGAGGSALGDTPFHAWMSWLKLSLSRYEVEGRA